RRVELYGSGCPVEGGKWDASRQADCACQWVEGEPRDREVPGCCGPSAAGAVGSLRCGESVMFMGLSPPARRRSGWLTPGQIAVMLRSAYDPAIAATLERHGRLGQSL